MIRIPDISVTTSGVCTIAIHISIVTTLKAERQTLSPLKQNSESLHIHQHHSSLPPPT
ncbi:hypothetical protein DPMN_146080 [Dreissena polymorpha]|uniref:Uncharacterized protein n=1 Tax=Dreissena polymorpha TaxID=45954 RepID=A0A9D4F784_DREPO|nr:hypothetical protein DPMN_146080 [Dreissena polymorpha]